MISYPVFALRRIDSMEEIDGVIHVAAFYSTYVLDDRNLYSDSFLERRVLMLANNYEYKLYPLKFKCDNLIQINRVYRATKYTKFIDAAGRIATYVPSIRVRVTWHKCKNVRSADGMFYAAIVEGEPYHFVTKEPHAYLALISYKGGRHVYDVSNTKPEKEVMWRRI
jgi:hypothetical protein